MSDAKDKFGSHDTHPEALKIWASTVGSDFRRAVGGHALALSASNPGLQRPLELSGLMHDAPRESHLARAS